MKKLTKKRLEELVREVIYEQAERTQEKPGVPGNDELLKLGRGVLEEDEILAEPDEEGFVKIKVSALERLLSNKNTLLSEDMTQHCNKKGFYKIDQILDFIAKLKAAEKGKA